MVRSVTVANPGSAGIVPGWVSDLPRRRSRPPLGSIPRMSSYDVAYGGGRRGTPAPLKVATALTGLEAGALLLQGVSILVSLEGERLTMGMTSVVFFIVYGAGLGWCALALRGRQSWARSPVVFAQLIQLGVASSFWGGETTYVAVTLALIALVVLAGVFHPQSLKALNTDPAA